jgi:hypothetical protein
MPNDLKNNMNYYPNICTYFDFNYLPRGLALLNSIKKYHLDFRLFILAFDDKTYEYLLNLNEKNIVPISFKEYNRHFNTSSEKFQDKKQYYFSATPNLCLFIFERHPNIDILLYLDADVYLFDSLDSLYEEFGSSSIGLTPHRINPFLKPFVKHYGKFNVGVNLFRNDELGNKCLNDWKKDCETWYPGKPGYPLQFFSDQIFLDSWDEKYQNLIIIQNIGVNVVYWNVANYRLSKKNDKFYVNKNPIMIFHFSSLVKTSEDTWNSNSIYGIANVRGILLEIYLMYIKHIESFGLDNSVRVKLKHDENLKKRIAHFIIKRFLNEEISFNKI